MPDKTALITGATSGIGRAIARLFAQNGMDLLICGRREERLQDLQQELGAQVKQYLVFDVRQRQAVEAALQPVVDRYQIDILVNNAGNAHGLAPIHQGDPDDWDAMIDGNVKGLLYVSRMVIPQMVERQSGHIINIGSIAGKEVYPNGNVYCASKHAVDAINNGMRLDLNPYGIKVSQISPGLVETEFSKVRFKGDEARAASVYADLDALQAEDIAELALFMATRPPHVNISDVIVLPTAQASSTVVDRSGKKY
ncbi:MAG TPA: SDR family NAD(P)-dependent oxidoreductase [Flammeovirgaceae bacterium]|nr:SDR family NAD(P)-dependent oxidoreductase [Flammeovirgaceae bacterium]